MIEPVSHRSSRGRDCGVHAVACSIALLAPLLSGAPAQANTLGPGHRAWATPGVDARSVRAMVQDMRERAAQAATPPLRTADPRARWSPAASGRGASSAGLEPLGFAAWGGRMLVVPVLFVDDPPQPPLARDDLTRQIADETNPGSLVSVFRDLSRGAFAPQAYVTPWVRLPRDRMYYSNVRDGTGVGNAGPRQLARHAACLAAVHVDVTAFDDDGPDARPGSGDDDGIFDLLLLLHPDVAFEVDPSPEGPRFLSHMDRAPRDSVRADCGVGADPYVLASARGPLGVWTHECMHLLGLEDLYDVSVNGTREDEPARGGLGIWSLMADGAWGADGSAPSDLDAASRALLGWGTGIDASGGGAFSLARSEDVAATYLELRPLGRWEQERFLFEARGPRAGRLVDGALPGTGVLIYHVDDAVPQNCGSPTTCPTRGAWVELLQADGRRDLEDLINNGDGSDPFTGAGAPDRIDPATIPSSQSHRPDPSRVAPALEIDPPGLDGAYPVRVTLAVAPQLRLLRALFADVATGDRAWLRPGETRVWQLRFADAGPTASTVTARVIGEEPGVDVLLDAPATFLPMDGAWQPAEPLLVRATAPGALDRAPVVRLGITVDQGTETEWQFGIPVGLGPGLAADGFAAWAPGVLAAPFAATEFDTLEFEQLPLPTVAGWITRTGGADRYARDVDVELVSPWFAAPSPGEFALWSRIQSEASQPGDAWDGGVFELWHPQQGWSPLTPEAGPLVRIVHRSTAAVRGRVGVGGEAVAWNAVRASLPELPWPTRVRVRFASNGAIEKAGWAVAGAGTEPSPGRATLTTQRNPRGTVLVDARITGDLTGVTRVRLAWKRPLDSAWTDVDPPRAFVPSAGTISFSVTLPADAAVVTFGLFTDEDPRLLLGTAGDRAPAVGGQLLGIAPNPALGAAQIVLEPGDAARTLRVCDVRGRLIRTLTVPAFARTAIWDGRDGAGALAASGRYVVVLTEAPGGSTVLTLIR